MKAPILVCLVFGAAGSACTMESEPRADQPDHALLEGAEAPPLNRPLAAPRAELRDAEPLADLQEGPPVLVLTVNGAAFSGQLEATGTVSVSDGTIDFSTQDERVVHIAYRPPAQLSPLRSGEGSGTLRLLERSGPQGADRRLAIDREGTLLMGEIWQSDAEPIRFDLGSGLTLQQDDVEVADGQGAVAAPILVLDGGRVTARVPIGEATRVEGRAGLFEVFAQTSQVSADTGPQGQFGDAYVLHAWVVRVEQQGADRSGPGT